MPNLMPGYVSQPPTSQPYPETEIEFLNAIMQNTGGYSSSGSSSGPATVNVGGFTVPNFDKVDLAYYGTTNNLKTQIFSKSGTAVATLTYAYKSLAVANDDLVTVITQS